MSQKPPYVKSPYVTYDGVPFYYDTQHELEWVKDAADQIWGIWFVDGVSRAFEAEAKGLWAGYTFRARELEPRHPKR